MRLIPLIMMMFLLLSCTNFGNEELELISCNLDGGIDSCPEGYSCYYSQIQPKGGTRGPQTGDLLCHRNCEKNSDCPTNFPNCEETYQSRGDTQKSVIFCVK
ncbi:hypothetical protein GOV10_03375 [Candidatus Woesearchaeota archaeon]|nr:hypothetical protein [Candidatus Woesearchaeota archaeon]